MTRLGDWVENATITVAFCVTAFGLYWALAHWIVLGPTP